MRSDARELVTAGVDGSLVIWDIRGGGAASRFRADRSIGLVALSPDGDLAVAVGSDGQPRVVSRAGRLLHVLRVSAASFSPDGRWIASAGPIAGALWPAGANRPFMYVRGPADLLTDIIWSAEGFEIVASSRDGTIRTYSCRLCRPLDDLLAMARDHLAASS